MKNFDYEQRDDLMAPINNEEREQFSWSIALVEDLVKRYGVTRIMNACSEQTQQQIREYFETQDLRQSRKACALCS